MDLGKILAKTAQFSANSVKPKVEAIKRYERSLAKLDDNQLEQMYRNAKGNQRRVCQSVIINRTEDRAFHQRDPEGWIEYQRQKEEL